MRSHKTSENSTQNKAPQQAIAEAQKIATF
jgi:hypothetical protein